MAEENTTVVENGATLEVAEGKKKKKYILNS